MRYLRSKLYLVSIILVLLYATVSWAQSVGGGIGLFNTLEVNDSSFNYGFARHFYGGAGSAYRMNYTGSGGLLFDYQVNGASVFLLTGTGNINHLGPFTTYMLGLRDTDRTHALVHKWNEDDSTDRVINWLVTSANRSITLEGDTVLDQDLSSDSSPTFGGMFIGSDGLTVTGTGDGGLTSYDLEIGGAEYGMVKIGKLVIGRTSFKNANMDADGAVVYRNLGGPVTGKIEHMFTEVAGNTIRLAIPSSGAGNALYNSRSFMCIGPAVGNTDIVTLAYWQALGWFPNLDFDTVLTGADIGIQDDGEFGGTIFVDDIAESTAGAGVTFTGGLIIPSGITPAPDSEGALFLDSDESVNGSLMMYANGAWRTVADL